MTHNENPEIDWSVEGRRFDTVPEAYDAYRPDYPEVMIEAIVTRSGLPLDGKLLEIGSGTGKGTAPFARRGYSILCVEPGSHLVSLAAQKFSAYPGVRFANLTFEDWVVEEGAFNLVFSAQAFHWVNKAVGFPKILSALKPGGWLAVFWNMQPPDTCPVWVELDRVYQELAPALHKRPNPFEVQVEIHKKEIEACGLFSPVELLPFPWQATFDVTQYLGLISTYSDHLRLAPAANAHFYAGVADVINRHGGVIQKHYTTYLYMAQKPLEVI
jgi:SAM-dependent methyltransferase